MHLIDPERTARSGDRSVLDEIGWLYAYHRWAGQRMLDSVASLSDEQRLRPAVSSFPSVIQTVAHIVGADWVWLKRWQGNSPDTLPSGWEDLSLEQLRDVWTEVLDQQQNFIATLSEQRLRSVLVYTNFAGEEVRGELGGFMRHVVNHATYHRGQVTTLIRQVGGTPLSTDMAQFIRERQNAA